MKDHETGVEVRAPTTPAQTAAKELPLTRPDQGTGPGRLGTFAILGAAASNVPLPWVPDALTRRVRGALVQDVIARRGLSLTPEARAILAEPAGIEGPRGVAGQAMKFVTRKVLVRFGPLAMFPTVRAAVYTYVLGHLLARYLDTARRDRAVRVDVEEARTVRTAIDRALVHAITGELDAQGDRFDDPAEELRDEVTQVIDGLLIATAGVPAWLLRRVEAAFDEVIARG